MKTLRKATFACISVPLVLLLLYINALFLPDPPPSEAISTDCIQRVILGDNQPHRLAETQSLNWVELWRLPNGLPQGPNFIIAGQNVVTWFGVDNQQSKDQCLVALELSTGRIVWQTLLKSPTYQGTRVDTAYVDLSLNHLYLTYSYRVQAFDLQTGGLLWFRELNPGGHVGYAFEAQSSNPLVIYNSSDQVFRIDPFTGTILSRKREMKWGLQKDGIEFSSPPGVGLEAVDQTTNRVLWRKPGVYLLTQADWTIFTGEDMIYSVAMVHPLAPGAPDSYLSRVNIRTGVERWHAYGRHVSNMVLDGGLLYTLREDGALVTLNAESGQPVGVIQFDRPFSKIGERSFWVAVQDPYLLVYVGDSQELIVFKR